VTCNAQNAMQKSNASEIWKNWFFATMVASVVWQ